MAEHDEVDGYPLRRSWDQLQSDVVTRGRRLRRRRRAAQMLPVVAVLVVAAALVALGAVREDPETGNVDTPPATSDPVDEPLPALAFARFLDGGRGGSAIFVVDEDGSTRQVTPDPAWRDGTPTWSPDGKWIAFDSQRDNPLLGTKTIIDVYIMRADGTDVRRVTTTTLPGAGNGSQHPTWSPDGERLAIVTGDTDGVARIVVISPDGTGARAITDGPGDVFPAWSPDGDWIAFQRQDSEVWLVRPDGTGAHRLSTTDRPTNISWTPDSSAVTFADGDRIVSVPIDGGGDRTVIADGAGAQHFGATWLESGALLAYTSDPDGLYLVSEEPDGTSSHIGGPEPGPIVLAEPSGRILRTLSHPGQGDTDVSAAFAPP